MRQVEETKVTRLEVIDETGRLIVLYNVSIDLSVQDEGRTLKVFVQKEDKRPSAT